MSLATEFRPDTFEKFLGNESTIKSIQAMLARPRPKVPHAFLISGAHGCGKTTLGRIIANTLGAQKSDLKEVDAADFRGIDTIRDIRKKVNFMPQDPKSKCRVWIFDEVHMLGQGGASNKNPAQNAMLKMLEEAPDHVYFVLCTTEPEMLMKTIRSRCIPFTVNTLTEKKIERLIKKVSLSEKAKIPKDICELIAEQSLGHPRDALQLLEKVIDLDPEDMEEVVLEEAAKQTAAIGLARALLDCDSWKKVTGILKGLADEDEEKLRRMVLQYCNTILLKADNERAFVVADEFEEPFYNSGKPGLTLACYRATHVVEED